MSAEVNQALLRALENMLALVPDIRVTGACRNLAGSVIHDAKQAVMLAKGESHASGFNQSMAQSLRDL